MEMFFLRLLLLQVSSDDINNIKNLQQYLSDHKSKLK